VLLFHYQLDMTSSPKMADNMGNIVLEHLRALRAGQDRIETALKEVKQRLTGVVTNIAGLRRDNVGTQEVVYRQQSVIDAIQDRLQRIEKRLELL
jgi:hypothetical protein